MSITEGRTDTPGIFYIFLLTSKPIFKMKSLVDAQYVKQLEGGQLCCS